MACVNKYLLSFLLMLLPVMSMMADKVIIEDTYTNVNGIYYDFNNSSMTATVTCKYTYMEYPSGDFCYYSDYSGFVDIPSEVVYDDAVYRVTSIGYRAFLGCSGLTSITIPNSVTSIGDDAFEECDNLTSITIPNSVISIGDYAFQDCNGLTSITIGNSVTSIGSYAFDDTAWYDNQPDGLVYAGKVAYNYKGEMPANTHITIKDGTLIINQFAFWSCSGLTSVTIPNSVTSIGSGAFQDCSDLSSVTIPNSVTSIGWGAFFCCI